MKKQLQKITLLTSISLLLLNVNAQTILLRENFSSYTAGQTLESQPTWDWMSSQGTNSITIQSGGALTYTDYPESGVGNSITLTTSGEDLYSTFPLQSTVGTSVYASFLVSISSASSTDPGDYFFAFSSSPIDKTIYHGRVYVKKDTNNKLAFGVTRAKSAVIGWTGFNYDLNSTCLIVLKYDIVSGTANDACSITVNPVISNGENAATWTTTTATDTQAEATGMVGAITLRQNAAASSPALTLSGIRVATNWSDLMNLASTTTGINIATDDTYKSMFYVGPSAPSAVKTLTVSGTGLTNDIVITQIGNTKYFELSLDNSSFSSNVTLTHSGGVVAPTTVYARALANSSANATTFNNQFFVTSTGVSDHRIKMYGTVDTSTKLNSIANNINIISDKTAKTIEIRDIKIGDKINVYSTTGQLLSSGVANQNTIKINLKTIGIYLVTVNNSCSKVVL